MKELTLSQALKDNEMNMHKRELAFANAIYSAAFDWYRDRYHTGGQRDVNELLAVADAWRNHDMVKAVDLTHGLDYVLRVVVWEALEKVSLGGEKD
tara:strand:- start:3362 stop:3649 length:288 start_codon:yes stop_codon:yes gene_type:complete